MGRIHFLKMDRWLRELLLHDRLRRLFDLSETKCIMDADMFFWVCGKGGEVWKWQCRLLVWEE